MIKAALGFSFVCCCIIVVWFKRFNKITEQLKKEIDESDESRYGKLTYKKITKFEKCKRMFERKK